MSIRTCSAIHHGWLCVPYQIQLVKLRMTKGVVLFFPYRTAIRSGLTDILLGAILRTCSTRPYAMHGWLCLPCGIADDKASCLLLF